MKVILLAAGRGKRFGRRTARLPKCLIPLGSGKNLLSRYLDAFRKLGLRDVVIVVGHEKDQIIHECVEKGRGLSIKFLVNPEYKKGSIVSLFTAAGEMDQDLLIMDADVFFSAASLRPLLKKNRSAFLLDPRSVSSGEEMMVMAKNGRLSRISKKLAPDLRVIGEATGFFKVIKKDAKTLSGILKKMVQAGKTGVEYEDAYNRLMKNNRVFFETIRGFWTEMDFEEDRNKILKRLRVKP